MLNNFGFTFNATFITYDVVHGFTFYDMFHFLMPQGEPGSNLLIPILEGSGVSIEVPSGSATMCTSGSGWAELGSRWRDVLEDEQLFELYSFMTTRML